MSVINPYSQPELEDKGWEFSSDAVPVKPDDGSVTMQSLDEELSTLAQVCQSLVKDGYVYTAAGSMTTPLPPADYNRFWITYGSAGDNRDYVLMRVVTQDAGATVTNNKIILTTLNRIGTSSLMSGSVTTDKIDSGAVTWGKLAQGAVHEGNIAMNAVSQNAIKVGAVGVKQLDPNVKKSIADATPKSVLLQQDLVVGTVYTKEQFESMTDASLDDFYELRVGDYVRVTMGGAGEAERIVVARYDQNDPQLHYIVAMSPINGLLTSYTFVVDDATVTSAIVAIGTDSIANNAVTGAKIASGAVTQAKIGTSAVVTDKIKDGAVTSEKLDDTTQTLLSAVGSLFAAGYVYDPTLTLTNVNTAVPYARFFFNRVKYNNNQYGIQVCRVAANTKNIAYGFTWVETALGVQWGTGNITNKAITLPKLSDEVQTTLADVPKQYELTTTLEDENDMTPDAFLAKYGLSVDVIKGLRVGDSLHVDGTGETYGVLATYKDGNFDYFQLGHVIDESDVTYAVTLAVSSDTFTIRTYSLLRSDSSSQLLSAVTIIANLPWGQTVQSSDLEDVTKITSQDWRTRIEVGSIFADLSVVNKYWQVLRAENDIFYLGLYNEPQTDGTAKQIQYSIRLRYNYNRTALTSISFYADEIESGDSHKRYTLSTTFLGRWGTGIMIENLQGATGLTVEQWKGLSIGDVLEVPQDDSTSLVSHIYEVSNTIVNGDVFHIQLFEQTPAGTTYSVDYTVDNNPNSFVYFIRTNTVKLPWGVTVSKSGAESVSNRDFTFWYSLTAGAVLYDTSGNTWTVESVRQLNSGLRRIYLGCYYNEANGEATTGSTMQRSILVKDTNYWGGNDALSFQVNTLPAPYVPVEYTLPKDFPYNATDSQRYVSSIIGAGVTGAKLNEGDVFVYGNNRYKIISKSVKTNGSSDSYSFCFECSTFNGGAMGTSGATGYGGLFFTDGQDGCVVYTVQYSQAPASSESPIDGVQWDVMSGQKSGNIMLAMEPTETIEAVPYNREWIEMFTYGLEVPTFNVMTISAGATSKVRRLGYTLENNIGTPCLRAKCVTGAKIADKAVTVDKLSDTVWVSQEYALSQDLIFDTRYTPTTYMNTFSMSFDPWGDYVNGTGKAPVLTVMTTGSQVKKYVAGTVSGAGANRWMIDLGCTYDVDTSMPVRVYAIIAWDEGDAEWDSITFKKG